MAKLTQKSLILSYYEENQDRDVPHVEVVDWATNAWLDRKGKVFRDPDRAIRSLYQEGRLIKVSAGVYRYSPDGEFKRPLDFTASQKAEILERDDYQCVICGKGPANGVTLHVDHIKPKELGGEATIENGQALCSQHNIQKKTLLQTELGKKMFIRFYELAKKQDNEELTAFCRDILDVYDQHGIDSHILWSK